MKLQSVVQLLPFSVALLRCLVLKVFCAQRGRICHAPPVMACPDCSCAASDPIERGLWSYWLARAAAFSRARAPHARTFAHSLGEPNGSDKGTSSRKLTIRLEPSNQDIPTAPAATLCLSSKSNFLQTTLPPGVIGRQPSETAVYSAPVAGYSLSGSAGDGSR